MSRQDGADQVQAKEGQVRQVVLREAFAVQVGVDERSPAGGWRRNEAVQARIRMSRGADDHFLHVSPPVHEDPDLAFSSRDGSVSCLATSWVTTRSGGIRRR